MKIILLESINSLGRIGEVIHVKNAGYARNFLIPKGFAMKANVKNLAVLKDKQDEINAKEAIKRKAAEALKILLEAVKLEIPVETNEDGELFGSVGVVEIAKVLVEKGHIVSKRDIVLPSGQIHNLGDVEVKVICHIDVIAKLVVTLK